ncbi:hypothetical protein GCM10027436_67620 [Actinophytocola sediminis]
MAFGLSLGNATTAQADDTPPPVKVDFVGDSQIAGEGLHGTYFDANDARHQSRQAAPAQALARVVAANPDLAVDTKVAAASGALTMDFFGPQELDGKVVNSPQLDQVRADADVIVVGFGGSDAMSAQLMHAAAGAADESTFDTLLATVEPGLSALGADTLYREQAAKSQPGLAPTLTARLLQVLDATRAKAPNAKIVVTNYPFLVDPSRSAGFEEFSADELTRLREFGQRLNAAIDRAVRICDCATLADVSRTLEGREAYAEDPAVNDLSAGKGGPAADHRTREVFQPNVDGAGLIAEPIVGALAKALSVEAPKEPAKEPTGTDAIALERAVAKVPTTVGRSDKARLDKSRPETAPDRPRVARPGERSEADGPRRPEAPAREPVSIPVVREVVVVAQPIVQLVPVVLGIEPREPTGEEPVPAADEPEAGESAEADENGEVEEERTSRSWAAWRLESDETDAADGTPADEVETDEQPEPAGTEPEETEETEPAGSRWDNHRSQRAERDDAVERPDDSQRREDTEVEQATLLPCAVTEAAAVDMVPCPPVATDQPATETGDTAEEPAPKKLRYSYR